jgi:hypothetical protein
LLNIAGQTGERIQIAPNFLPDGDHFIYASGLSGSRVRRIFLASLASRSSSLLLEGVTSNAVYANGYILFLRERTLMAQRFDAASRVVSGEPMRLPRRLRLIRSPAPARSVRRRRASSRIKPAFAAKSVT